MSFINSSVVFLLYGKPVFYFVVRISLEHATETKLASICSNSFAFVLGDGITELCQQVQLIPSQPGIIHVDQDGLKLT